MGTYSLIARIANLLAHELLHPLLGLAVVGVGDYERHVCVVGYGLMGELRSSLAEEGFVQMILVVCKKKYFKMLLHSRSGSKLVELK